MNDSHGLTRRSLLCTGATAGVAVAVGSSPAAAAGSGAATVPGHLTRSTYAGLEGSSFRVETGARPVLLRLESVTGEEDAFSLAFSGPLSAPLESGIHTLHHPVLGSFELFSSPVDAPGADQSYQVVVDRSVGTLRAKLRAPAAPRPAATSPADEQAREREPEPEEAPLLRKVSLRRAGRWARCEVVLHRSVSAKRVRVRLLHRGKLVTSGARPVDGRRAVMRLEATRRLRAGTYTLVVTAVQPDGTKSSERRRISFR